MYIICRRPWYSSKHFDVARRNGYILGGNYIIVSRVSPRISTFYTNSSRKCTIDVDSEKQCKPFLWSGLNNRLSSLYFPNRGREIVGGVDSSLVPFTIRQFFGVSDPSNLDASQVLVAVGDCNIRRRMRLISHPSRHVARLVR